MENVDNSRKEGKTPFALLISLTFFLGGMFAGATWEHTYVPEGTWIQYWNPLFQASSLGMAAFLFWNYLGKSQQAALVAGWIFAVAVTLMHFLLTL